MSLKEVGVQPKPCCRFLGREAVTLIITRLASSLSRLPLFTGEKLVLPDEVKSKLTAFQKVYHITCIPRTQTWIRTQITVVIPLSGSKTWTLLNPNHPSKLMPHPCSIVDHTVFIHLCTLTTIFPFPLFQFLVSHFRIPSFKATFAEHVLSAMCTSAASTRKIQSAHERGMCPTNSGYILHCLFTVRLTSKT